MPGRTAVLCGARPGLAPISHQDRLPLDTTLDPETLLRHECKQLNEEAGQDFGLEGALNSVLAREHDNPAARGADLRDIYTRFMPAIRQADSSSTTEPNDLDAILALAPPAPLLNSPSAESALQPRMLGAWLGRIAGCMLGKPVEGLAKEKIDGILALAGETEITDYIPKPPPGSEFDVQFEHPFSKGCTRGDVRCAVPDDDINYTVLGLEVLERHGRDFTPEHVMEAWMRLMPAGQCWTAERVAYRNFLNGLTPPESALVTNPYREWIGAQIRADMWGYANPGNPREAASMAYRDACLSHRKNGIYGEMWAAACVAAAFGTDDLHTVLEAGLSVIPAECRLTRALRDVTEWHAENPADWRATWERIQENYGHYHQVHTINNACFVVLGLLYGAGDFTRTIGIAVHAGLDTDCNGATAGSILGAMIGADAIPHAWTAPLNDTAQLSLATLPDQTISDLACRSVRIARQ